MAKRVRHILVVEPFDRYGRDVLKGIHAYCRGHGQWEFHLMSA